ncbi:MAG: hypothetical protein ACRD21_09495 [Vicinamibacteria bacterium]
MALGLLAVATRRRGEN